MALPSKDLRAPVLRDEDLWVDIGRDQEDLLGDLPPEVLCGAAEGNEHEQDSSAPEISVTANAADEFNLELLLRDAARESVRSSKATSRTSAPSSVSRASPKTVLSPITVEPPFIQYVESETFMPIHGGATHLSDSEKLIFREQCSANTVDWVSNWSSRPEMIPPADWLIGLRHPQPQPMPMVGSPAEKSAFNAHKVPIGPTLLTHALMFVLGAATMFFVLKKYLRWVPAERRLLDAIVL